MVESLPLRQEASKHSRLRVTSSPGNTHEDGVVNEFGQVFDASKPAANKAVLPGLCVVDGAAIPGALAANPTWTISAQALKAVTKALA